MIQSSLRVFTCSWWCLTIQRNQIVLLVGKLRSLTIIINNPTANDHLIAYCDLIIAFLPLLAVEIVATVDCKFCFCWAIVRDVIGCSTILRTILVLNAADLTLYIEVLCWSLCTNSFSIGNGISHTYRIGCCTVIHFIFRILLCARGSWTWRRNLANSQGGRCSRSHFQISCISRNVGIALVYEGNLPILHGQQPHGLFGKCCTHCMLVACIMIEINTFQIICSERRIHCGSQWLQLIVRCWRRAAFEDYRCSCRYIRTDILKVHLAAIDFRNHVSLHTFRQLVWEICIKRSVILTIGIQVHLNAEIVSAIVRNRYNRPYAIPLTSTCFTISITYCHIRTGISKISICIACHSTCWSFISYIY